MIKTVFETEGLLGMTDQFTSYCDKILDFVSAEKFYIFTCVHMINSTNPKVFYRERSFKSLLRIFYFLANLKETIENNTFSKQDLNTESIKELRQYMLGLLEMLLGKLEAYQYIYPQIIAVVEKSKEMVKHLSNRETGYQDTQDVHGEAIVKSLETKIQLMIREAYNNVNETITNTVQEIGGIIQNELRKQMTSRERRNDYNSRGSKQSGPSPHKKHT